MFFWMESAGTFICTDAVKQIRKMRAIENLDKPGVFHWQIDQVDLEPVLVHDAAEVLALVEAMNDDPKARRFDEFCKKAMDAFDKIMEKSSQSFPNTVAALRPYGIMGRVVSSPSPSANCAEDENCLAPYVGGDYPKEFIPAVGVYSRFIDPEGRLHQHKIADGVDEIGQLVHLTKPETVAS